MKKTVRWVIDRAIIKSGVQDREFLEKLKRRLTTSQLEHRASVGILDFITSGSSETVENCFRTLMEVYNEKC